MLKNTFHPNVFILVALPVFALLVVPQALAVTFTVNSSADVIAAAPLDNGVCETTPGNNVCTLRAAIMKANHFPGGGATINLGLRGPVTYLLTIPPSGNNSDELTGDLNISQTTTIVGNGANNTIIDGNGIDRLFTITGKLSISGVTIQHGSSSNYSGGINNFGELTLLDSKIINNTAGGLNGWGGGIYNAGTLTLTNSIMSGNQTGSSNAFGGGIYNQGPLRIISSTISNNTTSGSGGWGGGLYNIGNAATVIASTISGNTAQKGGGIFTSSPLIVINSTISGNYSNTDGGGIYVLSNATELDNVTVTGNRANEDGAGMGLGGGVYNASGGTFHIKNSIIALNENVIPTLPFPTLNDDDCYGTIISQGNNLMYLINSSYCAVSGAVTVANPNLGPLQNNGGSTLTHALLTGSPAINAGNSGGCTDNLGVILTTDQRGAARPVGTACDIGAVEYGGLFPSLYLPLISK